MGKRPAENIALIGFSCTGKSRIGRLVAEELGFGFIDTDDLIVWKAAMSIPRIFAEKGELHFRDLESRALEMACEKRGMVIATGGGIVLRDENVALMRERAFVILLDAEVETIFRRNEQDSTKRPLLDGKSPAQVAAFKAERQSLYERARHLVIDTNSLTQDEVAREVIGAWREWNAIQSAG
jgi:shikimate kinase